MFFSHANLGRIRYRITFQVEAHRHIQIVRKETWRESPHFSDRLGSQKSIVANKWLPAELRLHGKENVESVNGSRQQPIHRRVLRAVDGYAPALNHRHILVLEIRNCLLDRPKIEHRGVIVAKKEVLIQMSGLLQNVVHSTRFAAFSQRASQDDNLPGLLPAKTFGRSI